MCQNKHRRQRPFLPRINGVVSTSTSKTTVFQGIAFQMGQTYSGTRAHGPLGGGYSMSTGVIPHAGTIAGNVITVEKPLKMKEIYKYSLFTLVSYLTWILFTQTSLRYF